MKSNWLFTFTAMMLLFFGSGFVLIPRIVFSVFGVALNDAGVMLAQVAGAFALALGILAWEFRNVDDASATRRAAIALFSFFVVKTIVTLLAQVNGVFNLLGWSIVALDGLLMLAYGYVLFVNPAALTATTN